MHDAIWIGWGLLAVGQAIEPAIPGLGSLTQLGALGVLAWVAWTQRQELRDLRKQHTAVIDTLCERWDMWEKTRHEDTNALEAALRDLIANK